MNKYGHLIYSDFPNDAETDATQDYTAQMHSELILEDSTDTENYVDFASFEGDGLDFDKYVYNVDALPDASSYVQVSRIAPLSTVLVFARVNNPYIQINIHGIWRDVTDEITIVSNDTVNGIVELRNNERLNYTYRLQGAALNAKMANTSSTVTNSGKVTIVPTSNYSGYGLSIRTFMSDYELQIDVTDMNGTTTYNFVKSSDEYYPFSYDGLVSADLIFTPKTNEFIKIIGYKFGAERVIDDDEWLDNPDVETHFSLTGEDLEYDTLTFTVHNNGKYNFLEGQKVVYTRTGRAFYIGSVDSDWYQSTVTCYDDVGRLEDEFTGVFSTGNRNIELWLRGALKGGNDDITVNITNWYKPITTFTGVVSVTSYREAARLLMYTTGLRLRRRENSTFELFAINYAHYLEDAFNDDNIVSVPTIEYGERYGKISFLRHYYKINKSNGRQEVFNGIIDKNVAETVVWNEPHDSLTYWYVSGQDAGGNDEYTKVTDDKFTENSSGAYYTNVTNQYNQRISIWGYPVNESHYRKNYDAASIPAAYKNNVKNITEGTAFYNYNNYDELFEFLSEIYSYYIILKFKSLADVPAGSYVDVTFDGKEYKGYVTKVKDEARGVYEYEVICK